MKDLKDVMEALTILLVILISFPVTIWWLKRKAKKRGNQ